MGIVSERGFTVIELMLFLGVTGALFAALMFGVNSNVTQERYNDSVSSYSTLLQKQYSEVLNTLNQRGNDWKCADDGTITQETINGDPRGATDCVILGRAVQVQDRGATIVTSSVVGKEPTQLDNSSDIAALLAYHPKVTSFDEERSSIDWGSSLVSIDKQPSSASFLILRSPASGLIRVFTSASALPADISSVISKTDALTKLTNCMLGDTGVQPIKSVSIDPRIASQDGVTVNQVDPQCN